MALWAWSRVFQVLRHNNSDLIVLKSVSQAAFFTKNDSQDHFLYAWTHSSCLCRSSMASIRDFWSTFDNHMRRIVIPLPVRVFSKKMSREGRSEWWMQSFGGRPQRIFAHDCHAKCANGQFTFQSITDRPSPRFSSNKDQWQQRGIANPRGSTHSWYQTTPGRRPFVR